MPFASFFTNNPVVAWVIVVLVGLGLMRGKEELDEARGRHEQRTKDEARARKVQIKLKEKSDETSKKVASARAAIQPVDHSRELSDTEFEQLFGYRRNQRQSAS